MSSRRVSEYSEPRHFSSLIRRLVSVALQSRAPAWHSSARHFQLRSITIANGRRTCQTVLNDAPIPSYAAIFRKHLGDPEIERLAPRHAAIPKNSWWRPTKYAPFVGRAVCIALPYRRRRGLRPAEPSRRTSLTVKRRQHTLFGAPAVRTPRVLRAERVRRLPELRHRFDRKTLRVGRHSPRRSRSRACG